MNYVWVWNKTNPSVTKPMYKFVGGGCENHRRFVQTLSSATSEPYSVLVVKPREKTFEKMYTSFTPEMAPPFKLNYKLPFKIS